MHSARLAPGDKDGALNVVRENPAGWGFLNPHHCSRGWGPGPAADRPAWWLCHTHQQVMVTVSVAGIHGDPGRAPGGKHTEAPRSPRGRCRRASRTVPSDRVWGQLAQGLSHKAGGSSDIGRLLLELSTPFRGRYWVCCWVFIRDQLGARSLRRWRPRWTEGTGAAAILPDRSVWAGLLPSQWQRCRSHKTLSGFPFVLL